VLPNIFMLLGCFDVESSLLVFTIRLNFLTLVKDPDELN